MPDAAPDEKKVKDVMHPVDDLPRVGRKVRLREAVRLLNGCAPGMDLLLVTSDGGTGGGEVIGYLTPRQILMGLEPEFFQQGEAPVLWSGLFHEICKRGLEKRAEDVMAPFECAIHKNSTLGKALYLMDNLGTRRLAVSDGREIVGIVCLSDIYHEVQEMSAAKAG